MTFKEMRKRSGKNIELAAIGLGVKPGTLRKYESGEKTPSTNILLKMKEIYKCNAGEIILALEENKKEREVKYGTGNFESYTRVSS